MYFLTSLLYLLLFYVIPGQIFFVWLAPKLSFLPADVALLALNLVAYVLIFIAVRISKFADEELDGYRIEGVRELKRWLHPEGTKGFTMLMMILLAGGMVWLAMEGFLPVATWPLYAAIAFGSLDTWKSSSHPSPTLPSLPDEIGKPPEDESANEKETHPYHFSWRYPPLSGEGEGLRYRETFPLVSEWDDTHADPAPGIRSLDDYGILPGISISRSILAVAGWFREESVRRGFSQVEELANVVAFVRSLPADNGETYPSPPEPSSAHRMLTKGGRSSEARAVLAATLLHQLGHEVALLYRHTSQGGYLSLGFEGELPATFCVEDEEGRLFAEVEVSASSCQSRTIISPEFAGRVAQDQVIPIQSY